MNVYSAFFKFIGRCFSAKASTNEGHNKHSPEATIVAASKHFSGKVNFN